MDSDRIVTTIGSDSSDGILLIGGHAYTPTEPTREFIELVKKAMDIIEAERLSEKLAGKIEEGIKRMAELSKERSKLVRVLDRRSKDTRFEFEEALKRI